MEQTSRLETDMVDGDLLLVHDGIGILSTTTIHTS